MAAYPIKPSAGCRLAWMPLGIASVCVEYSVEDVAVVECVLINGCMIGAHHINADIVAAWEEELERADEDERDELTAQRYQE